MPHSRRAAAKNEYLVEAQMIPGFEADLLAALEAGELGHGRRYARQLREALCHGRLEGRTVRWIEACRCASPMAAERQDLDQFFIIQRIRVLEADQPRPELAGQPLLPALRAIVAAAPRYRPAGRCGTARLG
jgi:hypothetical protein